MTLPRTSRHGVSQTGTMKYSINVLKMETLVEERDRKRECGSERKRGRKIDERRGRYHFSPLYYSKSRLSMQTRQDQLRAGNSGIYIYIYRMNIEIFPSSPLFVAVVVVVARRYRAETLIFQRSIEQRREKSIDRASPLPFPSPSPPIYLERVISRSRFSTMLHIRATPYRAFVTFYFDNNSSIDESNQGKQMCIDTTLYSSLIISFFFFFVEYLLNGNRNKD